MLSKSARGSEWALGAILTTREAHASILRAATRNAHAEMLRQAIAAGQITLLHPATKTPIGVEAAGDAALIRRDDLVMFAASMAEPIELVDPADAQLLEIEVAGPGPRSAPVACGAGTTEVAGGSSPLGEAKSDEALAANPLTTVQIAEAFGHLWKGRQTLQAYLGNKVPKWLEPALVTRAPRANKRTQHRWDPVKFAELLRGSKGIDESAISTAFRKNVALASWRPTWDGVLSAFHEFDD